jgi:ABC-type transport system involved in multi-copper enzyme maturation permease subunit
MESRLDLPKNERPFRAWLRRHLAPDTSSWPERLVGLALVAAAAALWGFAGRLSPTQLAVLSACWLAALLFAAGSGRLPLFGPVLLSDFVRSARRGRHTVLRVVYAAGLFLFLLALYRNHSELTRAALVGSAGMARFAETFCYTFLAAQFLAVAALTPAYVAGAIADEKDRKTLEFLLATDLRNREIVLGKLVSRLLTLSLLVITGLPILSLTQLWGGVDLALMLAFLAATGLTMLSLAGVSLLASVYSRNAREAIVLTYLIAAGFMGLTGILQVFLLVPGVAPYALTSSEAPVTVQDVVEVANAGSPVHAILGLRQDLLAATPLQVALPARLRAYAVFHLLVFVASTAWAVARLRALALQDTHAREAPRKPKEARRRWAWWRPSLGRRPLVWKEVWAERGLSFNWFGKAVVVLIVLCSFLPALWIGGKFLFDLHTEGARASPFRTHRLAEAINLWVQVVGTAVACLTLLGVAVRAASAIGGERDRQTLDSLLTAPVDSNEVLFAKWLGSVLSVRRAWAWLALVWLLGGLTGGLYLPSVPWLLLAWLVYASFLAVLGLWFSMTCRTTLRATVWTLLTAAALGAGHWYLWMVLCLPLNLRSEVVTVWVRFELFGLTPPIALAWLAFRSDGVDPSFLGDVGAAPIQVLLSLVVGLLVWGLAAGVLWRAASRRFRALSGRAPRVPAAAPPDAAPRPARSRWRRRLVAAAAVVVALIAGAYVWLAVTAERDLRRALQETDRLDPGWRLAEIEAAREVVPDDENAGIRVLAVRALIPRPVWPSQEAQGTGELERLPPEVRLTRGQRRLVTLELEEVEEALIKVRPLTDMPRGRYRVAWAPDFISTPLPHADAQYAVRSLLWYDLLLRADEGDPDGALIAARRMLNLGRSMGDEPLLISQFVRNWSARQAVTGAERVLAQGQPSADELAKLQRAFEEEETHPGLLIGARGDRFMMDGLMSRIQSGEVSWSQVMRFYVGPGQRDGDKVVEPLRFSLTPGAEKSSRAALLRFQNRFLEAAALPAEEQRPAFQRLEAERAELPWLARQFAVAPGRAADNSLRNKAALRCAAAALAAERFRLRHGRWPEGLDELVPDDLARVPPDPFDAAPMRFRRLDDGLVVYSVGPDGVDDGGTLARGQDDAGGKDVGFRLWDVARRRQEPPAGAGR